MSKLQHIVGAVGVFACLFILLFPPIRSPTIAYGDMKVVNGRPEGVHISRFSVSSDTALIEGHGIIRTEIDAGELLRELAFVAVLTIGSYLWLPLAEKAVRRELAISTAKPPPTA